MRNRNGRKNGGLTEPKAMAEIHQIRLKEYHTCKNMTPEEEVTYINDKAIKFAKKYGLKILEGERVSQ